MISQHTQLGPIVLSKAYDQLAVFKALVAVDEQFEHCFKIQLMLSHAAKQSAPCMKCTFNLT